MKKMIALFLVAAVAGTAVKAQDIPERKPGHHHMMHKGKHHPGMDMKQLNLTDEQKAQFKSQRETFKKQLDELKKNDNITVKDWKSRMETLRKENKAKMDGILTSDQKATLQKMRAEQKQKMQERGKERAEKMKTELGLSADQSAKLDANRKGMSDKMKVIRENKSLSEEQKREQTKALMKANKEKMKSILTEEQLKKMKELHQRKPGGERKKPDASKSI